MWKGTIPLVLGIFGEIVYTVPFAILVVVASEAWTARSPGKWMLGIRVVDESGVAASGATRGALRLAIRTVGSWGVTLGLVTGSWLLALVTATAGCVEMASALSGRPFHERWSHTTLVRGRRICPSVPDDDSGRTGITPV